MNKEEFHQSFSSFRAALTSFIFRLVTNKQDAEDLVQDSYLKAMTHLDSYQSDKASLKTWVYTIALNLAKNQLKKRQRWGENDLTICEQYHLENPENLAETLKVFHTNPESSFEMKEHLDYCFTCISKTLNLTQQICLLLKEVYGFTQNDIIKITGLSSGKVKHGIADARKNMQRIFYNRCALINKNGICHQCTSLNGIFNPKQDIHIRTMALKLDQSEKDQDKLFDIRLETVRQINPLDTRSILPIYFAENLQKWVKMAHKKV